MKAFVIMLVDMSGLDGKESKKVWALLTQNDLSLTHFPGFKEGTHR